jgi:quercetin dioxygenase-like cupin family protein
MIVKNADVTVDDLGQGVSRKILAADGKMMAVEVYFEQDAVGAAHSHPHEQIGYVVKGRFEATLGDEPIIIQAGDTYYVPPDIVHGVVALEEGVLLDVFTPQREDFLK